MLAPRGLKLATRQEDHLGDGVRPLNHGPPAQLAGGTHAAAAAAGGLSVSQCVKKVLGMRLLPRLGDQAVRLERVHPLELVRVLLAELRLGLLPPGLLRLLDPRLPCPPQLGGEVGLSMGHRAEQERFLPHMFHADPAGALPQVARVTALRLPDLAAPVA